MLNNRQYDCGDVQLDLDARVAYVAGSRVILTFQEFETLRRMIAEPGRAFTREELRLPGAHVSSDRTVDSRIMRLRRKLATARTFSIETVPVIGYRCWAQASVSAASDAKPLELQAFR